MSSSENREAINLLAQQIVQMMKQGQDANNKGFVSRQIKNAALNAGNIRGLNQIVAEQVGKTEIVASQVKGLETEIQDTVSEEMGKVKISAAQIQDLSAEVAKIVAAEIESATIDTAQIRDLSAEVADIVIATIDTADINWADIANLTAAIASISLAEIKDAKIGFAQIEGLVAGQALITEAVGGKVLIQDLSVTDANIVDLNANKITAGTLEVERLIIVGSEKSIVYAINVANGTVQLSQSTIDGGSITRKTITADQIIANGITAECLNVSEIFANEALIGAIKAQNIDVATLVASEAFITSLNAVDISNNNSLRLVVDELRKEIEVANTSSLGQQLILTFERSRAFETGDETLTVRAKVFKEGVEATSTVADSAFKWERLSGDVEADILWASDDEHQNKKELQLTKEDIGKSCAIRCTYTIDAESGAVLQAETNVFDHTILQTSHILIKDDLIDISSGGKINMEAGSDISIKSGGKISLEPGSALEVSLEDVKTSEDGTLGDTVDTIEQKITPEAMVTNVSSYVQNAKNEAIESSATQLTLTSESLTAEFSTVTTRLQNEVNAVAKEQEELKVYIRASGDGLEIGKEGDPAKFRADNRTLEVTNIKTERIGIAQKMSEEEEWAWIASKSGLSLKWIGGDI